MRRRSHSGPGAIYINSAEDLPYGPGNPDYEYDGRPMTAEGIVSELTYNNYAHNRRISPDITIEGFERMFGKALVEKMEARFQKEQAVPA